MWYKLLQVVTRLLSSRYQDVFALLVPSCCDKSGTSCYHLVRRLMTVTNLLQVVPTRLVQAVRNKLLRACCHQRVTCRRADDIRFVGTTCCESLGLIHWSKACLSKQGILGSGTTCKCLKLTARKSYACLSKEENFNFSEYILQYLPTRFNKSRTQDVNSSNDAINNLKFPVPWPNFIQQPTIYEKSRAIAFEQISGHSILI